MVPDRGCYQIGRGARLSLPLRLVLVALATSLLAPASAAPEDADRYFELRIYEAAPGELDALLARFRDHAFALVEKHGMTNLGCWVTEEKDGAQGALANLLAHESPGARERSWKAFGDDPEWKAVLDASRPRGRVVGDFEIRRMRPTEYSPLR